VRELARRLGVSHPTVLRWETGETRIPGFLAPALEAIGRPHPPGRRRVGWRPL
jgi:transcriptional regulator with XRE-family HTH domain